MYSLGDGEAVERHRLELIKGLIKTTLNDQENRNLLIKNARNKKTSSQTGFSFCLGDLYKKFNEIHLGPYSGCDVETMLLTFQEFLNDENARLEPCISFERNNISQGWGWAGSRGTLAIKWFKPAGQMLTMIGVMSNDTLESVSMADFEKTLA